MHIVTPLKILTFFDFITCVALILGRGEIIILRSHSSGICICLSRKKTKKNAHSDALQNTEMFSLQYLCGTDTGQERDYNIEVIC